MGQEPKTTEELFGTDPYYPSANSLKESWWTGWEKLGRSGLVGVAQGMAHLFRVFDYYNTKVDKHYTGRTKKEEPEKWASLKDRTNAAYAGMPWKDYADECDAAANWFGGKSAEGQWAGEVTRMLGGLTVDLPSIMMFGGYGLPIHGAVTGMAEGGWKGALVGAIQGTLMKGIIGGIGKLPTSSGIGRAVGYKQKIAKLGVPLIRPATWATMGAVLSPGDIEDKFAGAVTYGILGLAGGNKRMTVREFIRAYPKVEAKLSEKALRTTLKQLEPEIFKGMTNKEMNALIKRSGGARAILNEVNAQVKQFKEAAIAAGKIPKAGFERRTFIHYSEEGNLKILDPEFHGTGIAGEEASFARKYPDIFTKRLYMFHPKHKKPHKLKNNIYFGKIDGKVMYPESKIGKALKKQAAEMTKDYHGKDPDAAREMFIKLSKEKGYSAIDVGEKGFLFLKPTEATYIHSGLLRKIISVHGKNEGSTFDLKTMENLYGKEGFSVSIHKDRELRIPGKRLSMNKLQDFVLKNADLLSQKGKKLGTYFDKSDGKTVIDVVQVVKGEAPAILMARKAQQDSIYNLKTGEVVDVDVDVTRSATSNRTPSLLSKEGITQAFHEKPLLEVSRQIAEKIIDVFQVENRFWRIPIPGKKGGARRTGLAAKTFHTKVEGELKRTDLEIKRLSKKMLSRGEFEELTFFAANFMKLLKQPLEKQKRIKPAYKLVRTFFARYAKELQKRGIITTEFPKSAIIRLDEEIAELTEKLKHPYDPVLAPEEIVKITKQIKDARASKKFLKGIKYVHIPKVWLEGLWERKGTEASKILSEFFRERKSYDIEKLAKWLIKKGEIEAKDLDIRTIMASYAHTTAKKMALADLFESAKKDKLRILARKAPEDWVTIDSRLFPTFKGEKVHPVFADYLEKQLVRRKFLPPKLGYMMGTIKLLQFYNPAFLPMYDVIQAWWAGSVRSWRTFVPTRENLIYKAFKSSKNKDKAYWDMHYWGGFSTPYHPTWTNFMKDISRQIDNNAFMRGVKKYGVNPYRLSWDMAWTGDKFIRLITYHHYKARKMSSKDAAQTTARMHADYASIPPGTRQKLNWMFFTPTFKIAMASAQIEMIKNAGMYLTTAARVTGKQTDRQKAMAKGLVGLVSGILLRNYIMQKLGFETDQWGLKYVKTIHTDEGKKELVLHTASPDNVFLRYYHRFKNIPMNSDFVGGVLDRVKWDLHPLWQTAYEIVSNKSTSFEPICNPFDPTWKQWRDRGLYTVQRILRFTEQIEGMGYSKKRLEAQEAMSKDLGVGMATVLKWFVLPYKRSAKEVRVGYQMQKLVTEFKRMQLERPTRSQAELDKRLEDLQRKLDKMREKLENIK